MQVGSKLPKRKGLEVGYYDWEAIDWFIYVGSVITDRNTISEEIQCRITAAKLKSQYMKI
jgi:hypothetical protein